MSLNEETEVDLSTELEGNLDQATEESSEQAESDENQGVATEANESEQSGDEHDDIDLGDVLSGKAEPEENESKVPRSTRRLLRKNKRAEKELALAQKQIEQLTNSQPQSVQAQAPERDWDNETDEQYNFRSMQAVLTHQQQVNSAGQQHAQQVKQANEGLEQQRKVIDSYSEEVDKLNLPNYDDAEMVVLDAMPEGALAYMSKLNPSMTPKIIYHLKHNPEKFELFARLAHTDKDGFNYHYGKLDTAINELESKARRKHKQISKAPGDKALDNSGASGNSIQAKMEAAANKGDFAGYRKFKAQLRKN